MKREQVDIWKTLTPSDKLAIYQETAGQLGLPIAAVEKDWWIVRTLEVVFAMDVGPHLVFKGGTSLSKAWGLIDRFSEDVDLALDRAHLGFTGEMTAPKVRKLRKTSFAYISKKFFPELRRNFRDHGLDEATLELRASSFSDQDPAIIEVSYRGAEESPIYIQPRILIEIGCRSLMEPSTRRSFSSMIGGRFPGRPFADAPITVPCVNPERTFLEKLFLLHEEFQKPPEKIRVDRLSRHLYDVERMMDTDFAATALADLTLYRHLVEHRRIFAPVAGVDYGNHIPAKINPIPPSSALEDWRKDYNQMRESMIYRESLPFEELMSRLIILKERINRLTY